MLLADTLLSRVILAMHPLNPLLPDEIVACCSILKANFILPEDSTFQFKCITLAEPPKAEMLAWDEGRGPGPKPPRRGYVVYYVRRSDKLYEAYIDLENYCLLSIGRVKDGYHAFADGPEIVEVEQVALADEAVKEAIAKLELPEGTEVVSDPWIYGSDGVDDTRLQYQCFLYLRQGNSETPPSPDSNHYAAPLCISPIVDVQTMKVVRIQYLPTGNDFTPTVPKPYKLQPRSEYIPEEQNLRTDLKPLQVIQPEGVSFTVTEEHPGSGGAVIEWQKWRLRTGFNHREGLVLHNITYDDRSLFHRISLSEMSIPYGDPRPPYHKKEAFDLGDAGAGVMCNNLSLGCDCLGSIYYLSANLADDCGNPLNMPNVVCIHEVDNGLLSKHTNYRTGRAVVCRSRELIIQCIITVSNYEYILAFTLTQAGDLSYEVRATGILSTAPIDPDITESPYGTIVHPGVLAQNHQHIFSLRVDPAVDGPSSENRVTFEEAVPLPLHPEANPFGVGYTTKETPIANSGGFDTDTNKNRFFKIVHREKKNPHSHKNVGVKIHLPPFQKILAHPSSFHYRRAEFADRALYVTSYSDNEFYAAGKWTNQSRGGEGVRSWAARHDNVDGGKGPVLWVQFGLNHIPRTEDFPVMPVESLRVTFRPNNFWTASPARDVPPSNQGVNRSVLVSDAQGDLCCRVSARGELEVRDGREAVEGPGGKQTPESLDDRREAVEELGGKKTPESLDNGWECVAKEESTG